MASALQSPLQLALRQTCRVHTRATGQVIRREPLSSVAPLQESRLFATQRPTAGTYYEMERVKLSALHLRKQELMMNGVRAGLAAGNVEVVQRGIENKLLDIRTEKIKLHERQRSLIHELRPAYERDKMHLATAEKAKPATTTTAYQKGNGTLSESSETRSRDDEGKDETKAEQEEKAHQRDHSMLHLSVILIAIANINNSREL